MTENCKHPLVGVAVMLRAAHAVAQLAHKHCNIGAPHIARAVEALGELAKADDPYLTEDLLRDLLNGTSDVLDKMHDLSGPETEYRLALHEALMSYSAIARNFDARDTERFISWRLRESLHNLRRAGCTETESLAEDFGAQPADWAMLSIFIEDGMLYGTALKAVELLTD